VKQVNKFLDGLTMYRTVLYGLFIIIATSFIFSIAKIIIYPITALAGSLFLMITIGFFVHRALAYLFKSAPSVESWLITVLILFLILRPAQSLAGYAVLALAVIFALSSKYILTFGGRHIFNPVAISVVTLSLLGSSEIFWWVGSRDLFWVVFIVGLLVVRKIRYFDMVATFILVAISSYLITRGLSSQSPALLKNILTSGPIFFFALFMLTDPQTSPSVRRSRIIYATIVGVFYGLSFRLPPLYSSPELALIIGNLFAFFISSKYRLRLVLQKSVRRGDYTYEFSFLPTRPLDFSPGQYLEWTLPHDLTDSRGNRRYFTIASSPTEQDIKLVVRIIPGFYSSFKRALLAMQAGDEIWVSQLLGNFILPEDNNTKLVFIAGGIGITPFRSMISQQIDNSQQRDVFLYYSSLSEKGFAYRQLFNQARDFGLKPNYLITGRDIPDGWDSRTEQRQGFLSEEMLKSDMSDYQQRIYYLSGPMAMVSNYRRLLRKVGIPRNQIKTDYFPGF